MNEGGKVGTQDTKPAWMSEGAVMVGDEILKRQSKASLARKARIPEARIISIDNRILLKLTPSESTDLLGFLSSVLDREDRIKEK